MQTQWPGVAGMYDPQEARRYEIPLPNGILLYGPPGCGKTFIARKIGEKLGFKFVEIKPGDLASTYVHGTQGMIKEVFEAAARQGPTILFFDELDAFTPRREDAGFHYSSEVNEFLVRLNNCAENRVLVIGATNYAGRLDPAILRPGRLDQHYYVGLPDFAARSELFRHHLEARPCESLDWEQLAKSGDGYSAAEIAHVCTQAARLALIEQRKIGPKHLRQAIQERPPREQSDHRERLRIGFIDPPPA